MKQAEGVDLGKWAVAVVGGIGFLLLAKAAYALPGVDGISDAIVEATSAGRAIAKVVVGFIGAIILVVGLMTTAYKFNAGHSQGVWNLAGILGGAALVGVALTVLA